MTRLFFLSPLIRGQEPVHHRRGRHPRPVEPTPGGRLGRHGPRHRQEGQAGAAEKGHARRGHPPEEDVSEERRDVPLLRGQRGRHRQQQGEQDGHCNDKLDLFIFLIDFLGTCESASISPLRGVCKGRRETSELNCPTIC